MDVTYILFYHNFGKRLNIFNCLDVIKIKPHQSEIHLISESFKAFKWPGCIHIWKPVQIAPSNVWKETCFGS